MDVSESLKICLKREKMSKGELAVKLGITPQTVTVLAKSKYCSPTNLIGMCELFNMKASEFIALGE